MPVLQTLSLLGGTLVRMGQGVSITKRSQQPEKMLKLYEFEGCPYCRLVREVLTELDLDVLIQPCPKGGSRFRPEVIARGGKAQFPWLEDDNTGAQLYESDEIITYLYETYAGRPVPLRWRAQLLQLPGSLAASACRIGRGLRAKTGRAPEQPLVLYSFEASPFARLVREALCEMELPYILRNTGRLHWRDWVLPSVRARFGVSGESEQRNRQYLNSQFEHVTIPFLEDPNTGVAMGESAAILAYLRGTYEG